MNIVPRVYFISSMIPLPPPAGYWNKLHSAASKFIWNGNRPRVKHSIAQRGKVQVALQSPISKYISGPLFLDRWPPGLILRRRSLGMH